MTRASVWYRWSSTRYDDDDDEEEEDEDEDEDEEDEDEEDEDEDEDDEDEDDDEDDDNADDDDDDDDGHDIIVLDLVRVRRKTVKEIFFWILVVWKGAGKFCLLYKWRLQWYREAAKRDMIAVDWLLLHVTSESCSSSAVDITVVRYAAPSHLSACPGHHLTGTFSGLIETKNFPQVLDRNQARLLPYPCMVLQLCHHMAHYRHHTVLPGSMLEMYSG